MNLFIEVGSQVPFKKTKVTLEFCFLS